MVNRLVMCVVASAGLAVSVDAADWEAMKRNPAQIQVINMQPVPLAETSDKKGWAKVPAELAKYGPSIFMPVNSMEGVADITVLADGYLLLACNYDYQGNSRGTWDEEVWNERKFKTKGWHMMSKNELGGELVSGGNRAQVVFSKQVRKGEKLRIRCNKYDPPYPILLGSKP